MWHLHFRRLIWSRFFFKWRWISSTKRWFSKYCLQRWRSEEEVVTLFTGKSRLGHWTEVADECRPAQLEQGLDELQNNPYLTQLQLCHLVLRCSFKGVCKDKRAKGWKGKNFLWQNLSVLPLQYNQFQLLSTWLLLFDCRDQRDSRFSRILENFFSFSLLVLVPFQFHFHFSRKSEGI